MLKRKDNDTKWIDECFTVEDKCLLWLCYVHLKEMKSLPQNLYDPSNQSSGRIVTKVSAVWFRMLAYYPE